MCLLIEKADAVAVVTMDRPHVLNALSKDLRIALATAFTSLGNDQTIRAIVLTGAGERAFSAGLDLKELSVDTAGLDATVDLDVRYNPVLAIERCGKPVIAAINGVAVTGGLELALACDILIASTNARFADTHVRVGYLPGWGLSQKLSRAIGISRAKELSFSGNYLDADTAAAWGLVNRVLPQQDLLPAAMQLARDIANVNPDLVSAYKSLIDKGFEANFGDALDLERRISSHANASVTAAHVGEVRSALIARGRHRSPAQPPAPSPHPGN